MARVTGIGGIFFKSADPQALSDWYQAHLKVKPSEDGTVIFFWREKEQPEAIGGTVWAPFPQDTTYFAPSHAPFMINYRVDNLDEMLAELRAAGVAVSPDIHEMEFGRFGWASDPDGNRFELWEPVEAA